jgi:HlyD family secretion protein
MKRSILLIIPLLVGCAESPFRAAAPAATPVAATPVKALSAIGRLEPEGEVIRVSVPNAQDSRVNRLLVKEGDRVQENQVIAILQGIDRRSADLQDAEALKRLRQAELKKSKQGDAKPSALIAQAATVNRLELQLEAQVKQKLAAIANAKAVLKEAEQNYRRRKSLADQGAIAQAEVDLAQRNQDTAEATVREREADLEGVKTTVQAQIDEENAKLDELSEVKPVDEEIAQAQLEQANVTVIQRQTDLDDVKVRAPVSGQVLRINTRIGEQVNVAQGIVELARTDRMFVIAEIAESDVGQIKVSQTASIVTDYGGFVGEIQGIVEQVGLQIGRRTIPDVKVNGTMQDSNARIVEVKIRVDPKDNAKVQAFTGMQVRVRINL